MLFPECKQDAQKEYLITFFCETGFILHFSKICVFLHFMQILLSTVKNVQQIAKFAKIGNFTTIR